MQIKSGLPSVRRPHRQLPPQNLKRKLQNLKKKNISQTSAKINQQIKIITTLAHERNAALTGSFNQVLNRLLRRNHIAEVDVGTDWLSAAILEAMPAQLRGEEADLSMETRTLRDSSPLTGTVFPSYWPEHVLSFSEPSTPDCTFSAGEETEEKKEKKKKKKTSKEAPREED